jgi:mannose-6-phosphate isomerase-like protein (cupin superfamily)
MHGQTHAYGVAVVLIAANACKPRSEPAPPGPIEADLPKLDKLGLTAKLPCEHDQCVLDRVVPDSAAHTEATPLAIWEEDASLGSHVLLPPNTALDVLGVTLEGYVALTAYDHEEPLPVPERHAFLARGAGVTLRAEEPRSSPSSVRYGPARVLLIAVTSGEPILSVLRRPPKPWTERAAPIAIVDLNAQPDLAWGKGAYHARIVFDRDASPHASMTLLRMSGDAPVPAHVHEKEWEHMAILQGEGSLLQTADDRADTMRLEDGSFVSIPPRVRHEWRPGDRNRPFLGIQIYTPPGPEQRFEKLAAP